MFWFTTFRDFTCKTFFFNWPVLLLLFTSNMLRLYLEITTKLKCFKAEYYFKSLLEILDSIINNLTLILTAS
jgi:hypothetical protein